MRSVSADVAASIMFVAKLTTRPPRDAAAKRSGCAATLDASSPTSSDAAEKAASAMPRSAADAERRLEALADADERADHTRCYATARRPASTRDPPKGYAGESAMPRSAADAERLLEALAVGVERGGAVLGGVVDAGADDDGALRGPAPPYAAPNFIMPPPPPKAALGASVVFVGGPSPRARRARPDAYARRARNAPVDACGARHDRRCGRGAARHALRPLVAAFVAQWQARCFLSQLRSAPCCSSSQPMTCARDSYGYLMRSSIAGSDSPPVLCMVSSVSVNRALAASPSSLSSDVCRIPVPCSNHCSTLIASSRMARSAPPGRVSMRNGGNRSARYSGLTINRQLSM